MLRQRLFGIVAGYEDCNDHDTLRRVSAQTVGLTKSSGALITEVKTGSPAAAAGLRVGDIVLVWGDREVDHRSLPWIVAQAPAGREVSVVVWRDHAQVPLPVVPQKMPE